MQGRALGIFVPKSNCLETVPKKCVYKTYHFNDKIKLLKFIKVRGIKINSCISIILKYSTLITNTL